MSPKAYEQAREDLKEVNDAVVIDDKPYFPNRSIDLTNDEASLHASLIDIVHDILSHPSQTDDNASSNMTDIPNKATFTVRRVSGGCTNSLFLVSSSYDWNVLVRVFGAAGLIDRDLETCTYAALSLGGFAPGYWGRFANGRLEQWKPWRALETTELRPYARRIAGALAALHTQFVVPTHLQDYYTAASSLWTQLDDWWDQACRAEPQLDDRRGQLRLAALRAELDWLRETQVPADAPVVFCHNDALAANILVPPEEEDDATTTNATVNQNNNNNNIQLIDFEYGGMNFRSFDLANHFNEYAGGPPDLTRPKYDEWMPTNAEQLEFCRAYLSSSSSSTCANVSIDDFYREVCAFLLVNHLYWGLWAVNQAATEGTNEYDYMEYAICRLNQYWIEKKEKANATNQ